jgi:chemotaxis protein CheD
MGGSTGGDQGRRIQFWPHNGAARQKLLGAAVMPAQVVRPEPTPQPEMNGVELF